MDSNRKHLIYHLAITIVAALLFFPFLGSVHLFDWDEINFAECAREMIASNNYSRVQLNFQPFWEKPPLFIWLQVLSMKIFGVTDFAARFPNAVCGVVTLNLLYYIGRKFNNHKFGLLWVLCYAASFLPFLYFKSGIIDPWFNLFIFLSICFLIQWFNNNVSDKINTNAIYAGVFAGLAVLTKGPVALLIIGLTIVVSWIRLKINLFSNIKNLALFVLTVSVTGLSWFLFEIATGNYTIVQEFITYQIRLFSTHDSDHEGFLLYHPLVLLIGCFPASIFFIKAHVKSSADTPFQIFTKKWMLHLFWVVLILFTIVKTKIVHYSSMCYFPLTFLAAYTVYNILYREVKLGKLLFWLSVIIISATGIAFTSVGLIEQLKPLILNNNLIKDNFAVACLKTPVKWHGFEWIVGILFLTSSLYFIFRLKANKQNVYGLFITSLLSVWLLTVLIVPKVEPYSQGPVIEFYETLVDKDCYVETIGFKSYAYMFYTQRKPQHNSPLMLAYIKQNEQQLASQGHIAAFSFNLMSMNWMLNEKIDKPAYFVGKITEAEEHKKQYPDLIELYRKGGFVFYKRLPNNN